MENDGEEYSIRVVRNRLKTRDARQVFPAGRRSIRSPGLLVVFFLLPETAPEAAADLDLGAVFALVRDRHEHVGHLDRGLEFVEGQFNLFLILVLANRPSDFDATGDLEGLLRTL